MRHLALALALFLAPQDEKIALKFNPKKGDKLENTFKLEMLLKFTVEARGKTQESEIEARGFWKRAYEHADVADGQVTRMIIDCSEHYSEKKQSPSIEWTRINDPMHGRKVTLFMKDGQLVREGVEGLKENDVKKLDLKNRDSKILPSQPVAVGESWEIKNDDAREFLVIEPELTEAALKCSLSAVQEMDKRRCAVIAATLEGKTNWPNKIEFGVKVDFEIVVWIDRGYILSSKGKGKVTMKGENDKFKLKGEGTITSDSTNKVE